MAKTMKKAEMWNQTVPGLPDSALETIDGKDPGHYKRYDMNGHIVNRELTVEIGVALAGLSTALLSKIMRVMKLPHVYNGSGKGAITEAFQDMVIRAGVKQLVSRMTRATIKKLSQSFGLVNAKQRNIVEVILRMGLPSFLHEKCDVPLFVDFCEILGLEAGKQLTSPPSPQTQPSPPYITYVPTPSETEAKASLQSSSSAPSTPLKQANAHMLPSGAPTGPTIPFTPKSSVELERELADEIMLIGVEEMLRTLTVPVLYEICLELELLPELPMPTVPTPGPTLVTPPHAPAHSNDPSFFINLIMDHIFDLIPLNEYTKQITLSAPPRPSLAPISSATLSSVAIPSSPFLSATENAKKRRRDEIDLESETPSLSSPDSHPMESSAFSPTSTPSKKVKLSETSSAPGNSHAGTKGSLSPAGVSHDTASNTQPQSNRTHESIDGRSMDVDTESHVPESTPEVKRPRGRPPKNPPASATAPPSSPPGNGSTQVANATSPSLAASSKSAPGRRGNQPPATPSSTTAAASTPVKSPDSHSHTSPSQTRSEETVDASPSEKRTLRAKGGSSPPATTPPQLKMRGSLRNSTVAGQASNNGRSASQTGGGSESSRSESGSSDEAMMTESDSSDEEENMRVTPSHGGGKGRAKYQAPPLTHIKKGITAQDLHNMYNVTDLQDWCRLNKVDHHGKKSAVIKRILYTLDPVNMKPPPPKKSRRFSSR